MTPILVHLRPFDLAAAVRIDVRLADAANAEAYGLGGLVWSPYITERPVLSLETMAPDLDGRVQAGRARLALNPLAMPAIAGKKIKWRGGTAKIYTAAALAWPAVLEFDGEVLEESIDNDGLVTLTMEVKTDFLEGPLLTAEFTGGGGATGEAGFRGVLKPAGFGTVENIEPLWFNTTLWIGCIDGYGNTTAITRLMEGLDDRGARIADYANYAALAAAITGGAIPPGRWGSCVAEGLVGLGAPPVHPIGVNATFGTNRIGAMMQRILEVHLDVPTGNIDTAAFAAMDAACPYDTTYWTKDQRDTKDLIEAMAGSINATPLVTFQNKVTITRGVTTAALAELVRSGRQLPRVIDVKRAPAQKPVFRLKARTARPANVLTYDQVLYKDTIEDRGLYQDDVVYRAGHVVWLADGSSWLYINDIPDEGNPPPEWPDTENAWWENMTPPTKPGRLWVQSTPPSAAESQGGDIWQDDDGVYWYRRDPNRLSIAGEDLTIGGEYITITWQRNLTQPVRTGLDAIAALAADALATADGKVQTFLDASPPVAGGIGDLWFDTDDGNKQYRWSGTLWVLAQDQQIGQAILDAAGAQATADGKVTTYVSEIAPTATALGDLWFKNSAKELRRWDGATWGDPMVDLTASGQVVVVPSPTFNLYRTWEGTVKPDQLPADLTPAVTKGGVDKRTDDTVHYTVTGFGGLAGKVSVENADGDPDKGRVTLANTITSEGHFELAVTVNGISVGIYTTQVVTIDDGVPVDNGGAGGTDNTLETVVSTSYLVMSGQDVGDPVLDVVIAGGETLKLNINFQYQLLGGVPATDRMICKAECSPDNWMTVIAMDSGVATVTGSYSDSGPVEERTRGDIVGVFTKTGLSAGTYKVRLLGRADAGIDHLQPRNGGATSSKS